MDDKAKRLLMEQIDKSLLAHTVAAGTKEGGPDILDAYLLQGLTETHYYPKAEHDFKPDEAAALLQFADPLAVAQECWEERDPAKGFPICDLLKEIKAYDRFPLADPADYAQQQEQMVTAVKAVLDQNMAEYHASLLNMDKEELIAKSVEIAATREAYSFMKEDFKFERGDMEILLRVENPLKFVAGHWPSNIAGLLDMDDLVEEAIEEMGVGMSAHQEAKQPVHEDRAVVGRKPSVLEQIKASRQQVHQPPLPVQEPSKGSEAR